MGLKKGFENSNQNGVEKRFEKIKWSCCELFATRHWSDENTTDQAQVIESPHPRGEEQQKRKRNSLDIRARELPKSCIVSLWESNDWERGHDDDNGARRPKQHESFSRREVTSIDHKQGLFNQRENFRHTLENAIRAAAILLWIWRSCNGLSLLHGWTDSK